MAEQRLDLGDVLASVEEQSRRCRPKGMRAVGSCPGKARQWPLIERVGVLQQPSSTGRLQLAGADDGRWLVFEQRRQQRQSTAAPATVAILRPFSISSDPPPAAGTAIQPTNSLCLSVGTHPATPAGATPPGISATLPP
jgi:hypothetical protein